METILHDKYSNLDACLKYLEIEAGKGLIKQNIHFQKCFSCDSLLFRYPFDPKISVGSCRVCHTDNFCWVCGSSGEKKTNEEKTDTLQTEYKCSNPNCESLQCEEIFSILSTCEPKTITNTDEVPEIRACPRCCQLIFHIDGCKHMDCSRCGTQFCFVCMNLFDETDGWPCGQYDEACPIYKYESSKDLPQNYVSNFPYSEKWK